MSTSRSCSLTSYCTKHRSVTMLSWINHDVYFIWCCFQGLQSEAGRPFAFTGKLSLLDLAESWPAWKDAHGTQAIPAAKSFLCCPLGLLNIPQLRLLKIFVGRCLQLWIQASFLAMAFHSEGTGAKDKAATFASEDRYPRTIFTLHKLFDVGSCQNSPLLLL